MNKCTRKLTKARKNFLFKKGNTILNCNTLVIHSLNEKKSFFQLRGSVTHLKII